MKTSSLLFLLTFLLLIMGSCNNSNPELSIEGGRIIGVPTQSEGIIAYKGIPFAAPPLGDLRWQAPQPVNHWNDLKVADTYGPAAEQITWDPDSFYGREWRASGSVPFSEDCLYLNVWTPAAGKTSEKLPVAIWIHGGGYREGFAFEPEMDGGEDWAAKGVVLVTITYRLGVMGFFSHPLLSEESTHGVSGNYGLLDQIAGLKWVHNNINAFGGDPENITIFGQSAGAGSVKALCSSPLSKDLISQAIIMSGGGLNDSRPSILLDSAAIKNKKMMAHFGKNTLEEMRELSFDEIMEMSKHYSDSTNTNVSWRPVIDGYLSNASFSSMAIDNKIADIPYMIGFTSNDMSDMTNAVSDFSSLRSKESDKPTYTYLFQRQLPGDESGAFHSADLWYVFHSLEHSWRPFTAGDEALSNKMVNYWTNFAKFGNPNGKDGVHWTPYTDKLSEFMILDANENKAIFTMSSTPKYGGSSFRR